MLYNEALKAARLSADMTQVQVAESLHITQQTVQIWESGKGSAPSISRLVQLADLYNVSLDRLVGREVSA